MATSLGLLLLVLACLAPMGAAAAGPSRADMAARDGWMRERLQGEALPFSFRYGGREFAELAPAWRLAQKRERLTGGRTRRTRTWTDGRTGLEVGCVAVAYNDFPTVEWTVTVRNRGATDSPLIEGLQALDDRLIPPQGADVILHRFVGSPCQENDYQPLEEQLPPGSERRVTAAGGRPTSSDLCYFALDWRSGGAVLALGWPGQWAARLAREADGRIRLVAGQEKTHLVLHPGEQIRTPLVALQFRQGGDWIDGQNVWRRWMTTHNLPQPGGKPVPTHYGGCFGNPLPRAEEEIRQIDAYLNDGVTPDYWFIDAGWYPCRGAWPNVGTWEPDPERFPKGLREVADHLHARGIKFIVWFEPERVAAGTWLAENRPQWVLGGKAGGLTNMGDPEARAWIIERVDKLLGEGGIDVYRGDYNIDPLPYWQAADAPDRVGWAENAYVTGFLAFWDELLRRRPDLYIDTCASGGRRNDLETLRRSVPLLRSDWAVLAFNEAGAIGQQAQTYGISFWIPYHGTGAPSGDPYIMRSSYCPAFRLGWDAANAQRDPTLLRKTVAECRAIAPAMLADYYPLTPYSLARTDWMAWQYHDPKSGEGAVQAFRRPESATDALTVRLRGLKSGATYVVEDMDGAPTRHLSGKALMREGLTLRLDRAPGSAVLRYRLKQEPRPARRN
ncbi:MAG: alpha-galactosidase [Armatimonadetes bacterium]|nr:alpha-galactosidase [Armatimonadota bacterium]